MADTLPEALARAYDTNPTLNALRESVLAANQGLPIAASGTQPRIEYLGQAGYRFESVRNSGEVVFTRRNTGAFSLALQAVQPVFDGFRTRNSIKQAASQVLGAKEVLRNSEPTLLFNAASAYAEVFANRAILDLNRRYIKALRKQLRQIKSLRELGDAVGSDVAEVEARLAAAQVLNSRAAAALEASIADYQRTVGKLPERLQPAQPIDGLVAASREAALAVAMRRHPAILAARHSADESRFQVAIVEADSAPAFDVVGSTSFGSTWGSEQFDASVLAQVKVPIYTGGKNTARAQQAKYLSAQRQLDSQSVRDQVSPPSRPVGVRCRTPRPGFVPQAPR